MKKRLSVIGAMTIFGTIGIFRKFIDLPSSGLAVARGLIGAAFLLVLLLVPLLVLPLGPLWALP